MKTLTQILSGWFFLCGLLGCPVEDDGEVPVAEPPPAFAIVEGSTERICRLTGEWDEESAAHQDLWPDEIPAHNLTGSRFELLGTDLGSSFEHDGKLWFLFGDTFATLTIPGDPEHVESTSGGDKPLAADATAWSADDDPTDCVDLTFLTESGTEPDTFLNPAFDVDGGTVQQDGVSVGGSMYVWFSSMNEDRGSQLARSDDHGRTFEVLYPVSKGRFIGIQAVLVEGVDIPGLEDLGTDDWVLLFGTGDYRASDLYLAAQPLDDLDVGDEIHVFAGLDDDDLPTWSRAEADAQALVDTDNPMRTGDNPLGYVDPDKADAEGCVSEFSVHYNPHVDAWIAMYNCDIWSIEMHSAAAPWGPWTAPTTVFDPVDDDGYCGFIHISDDMAAGYGLDCDVNVTTPDRADPGSPYGPYVMERYSEPTDDGVILYFVMSTWHPYNVHVMTTELRRAETSASSSAP